MHLIVLLYALFASVFTVSKTGLQYTQPLFFVGTRMLLAGVLILGYLYFFQNKHFRFSKKDVFGIFRLAVFNIYLTNMFEFWGLQHLTSFKTCFIYSLSPFLSALFSYWMFSEKMTSKKWMGFALGFLGFIPILLNESSTEERLGHLFFLSWAEIAVMLAAVSSVYGWTLLRKLVKQNNMSPLMANGLSMLGGGAFALCHSAFTENWNPVPITNTATFLECALLLIVISNLVCYNLYGFLLRKYTSTFMSFAGFTTPLWSAFFGWLYLGEVVTLPFYLSAIVVFLGLILFFQEELKQGYYAKPQAANYTQAIIK